MSFHWFCRIRLYLCHFSLEQLVRGPQTQGNCHSPSIVILNGQLSTGTVRLLKATLTCALLWFYPTGVPRQEEDQIVIWTTAASMWLGILGSCKLQCWACPSFCKVSQFFSAPQCLSLSTVCRLLRALLGRRKEAVRTSRGSLSQHCCLYLAAEKLMMP